MNAIAYIRVSTTRQGEQGASLEHQADVIAHEIGRRGWELAETITDLQSGKRASDRAGLQRAIALCETGQAGALVVSRLDRLSRNPIDVYDLMDRANRNGWALVILDPAVDMTTPMGRAMAGIAAVFAQLEREMIGQRTREGIAAKKAAGTFKGGRALPQCSPVAGDAVTRIMRHHRLGRSSRQIAALLDTAGVQPPRGAQWSDRTVRAVIQRHTTL